MNPEKRDLGITLVLATVLLLSTSYLAQCSSTTHQTVSSAVPAVAVSAPSRAPEAEAERERAGGADAEDNEERAKIQGVAHAIQTIGADPELRRTYGFPP